MMIFDRFPTKEDAKAFAEKVTATYGREATVYDSQEESNKVDIFPFQLDPPIVLVERDYENFTFESEIEMLVKDYKGIFAGT